MTPKFEDALDVSPLDDGVNWVTLEPFHYDTNVLLNGIRYFDRQEDWDFHGPLFTYTTRIEVPKDFHTDFASIPRALWTIVGAPAEGKYRKAAVVHDLLYRTKGLATRFQADCVLLEAMKASKTNWLTRHEIFLGVRIGGHSSYKGGL